MPETELAGARRSLSEVAKDPRLPAGAVREIEEVIRTIRRVEKSWSAVLPYLVGSNGRLAALLGELAPFAPTPLAAAIDAALAEEPTALGDDPGTANRRHEMLRGLLAQFVVAQPQGDTEAVRARILGALRNDLETRPW